MGATVRDIAEIMEEIAPLRLAADWDKVGLLVGDPENRVTRVLVTLDVSRKVVHEAENLGAELIVCHHPLFLKPIETLAFTNPISKTIALLMESRAAVYAAHTNLDVAPGGTADSLAQLAKEALGWEQRGGFGISATDKYCKLVVFVPRDHEEAVRNAICEAGAGWIGKYSHCTFRTEGTGTFLPLEGAQPFSGKVGEVEQAEEVRLETILSKDKASRVVRAMLDAHPYEEVAFDLYPLENQGKDFSFGRIGVLGEDMSVAEVAARIIAYIYRRLGKSIFMEGDDPAKSPLSLRPNDGVIFGDPRRMVKKVAIVPGSGMSFAHEASRMGCEVIITGDVKHHSAIDAVSSGLEVIDIGHWLSEAPVVMTLRDRLSEELKERDCRVKVFHFLDTETLGMRVDLGLSAGYNHDFFASTVNPMSQIHQMSQVPPAFLPSPGSTVVPTSLVPPVGGLFDESIDYPKFKLTSSVPSAVTLPASPGRVSPPQELTKRIESVRVYTDGASRGNPGPAAIGVVIMDDTPLERGGQPGTVVERFSRYLGETTNNVAEYYAMIAALERALSLGARNMTVFSDSELMVRQMKGEYKVKNHGLRDLFFRARALASKFSSVTFQHIPREENQEADRLCNEELDRVGNS